MMVVCAARSVLESNTKMGRAATYPTIIIIQKYIEAFRATSAETMIFGVVMRYPEGNS